MTDQAHANLAGETLYKLNLPDLTVSVREVFGLDSDLMVPAFSERTEHVPEVDTAYVFDPETTLAILAGFSHNRRVMVQGRPVRVWRMMALR